ncbi:hypothetical protein [Limnohabitans sp.]|uniref:hypothetical protein n=1 Tax=Limnohabitans sp. TaxID=1907725 RepID=UPI0037C12250
MLGLTLEPLTKNLPIASAALLVMSVVHDYFYLQALGLEFSELPTTISDHLRSAIVWLPGLGIAMAVGFLFGATGPLPSDRPKLSLESLTVDLMAFASLIGVAIASTHLQWQYTAWALATFVSLGIFRFQEGAENIDARFGAGSAKLLLLIPAFAVLVGGFGWRNAEQTMGAKSALVSVQLKVGADMRTVQVNGIRRFESAAILIKPNRVIEMVQTADLVSARHTSHKSEPVLCLLFGYKCSDA